MVGVVASAALRAVLQRDDYTRIFADDAAAYNILEWAGEHLTVDRDVGYRAIEVGRGVYEPPRQLEDQLASGHS